MIRLKNIGERVKYRRSKMGLSQTSLAEKVGAKAKRKISQQAIQQLENGNTERPRYLTELASVLEVQLEWLIEGVGYEEAALTAFSEASANERELLEIYRKLSVKKRRALLEKAKLLHYDEIK